MPLIPFDPLPTVAPASPPGVFQNIDAIPAAFGTNVAQATQGLGRSIEGAGDTAAQSALMFQKQYNETATDQANTDFEKRVRDSLFGPSGFYSKRGADAMEAMEPTEKQLEQTRQDVRNGLRNPEQQKLFDYMSRRSASRELYQMQSHATTEFRVWQGDTATGAINNEINNSATYWNDDTRFAESLGKIKIQANKLNVLKGVDPESEAGKANVTHYTSEAWSARIRSVMAQNADVARDMFDQNADYLDAGHRASLDQQITSHQWTQTMRENAQVQREEALAQKQLHITQTAAEADFMARAVSGKAPGNAELAQALRTQTISPAAYHSIIAVSRGNADAPSDPRLLASYYARIGDPSNPLTKDEVLRAAGHGLHGGAAASLMQALNAQGRREDKPEERGYYDSLKIALGGHNVEKGLVDMTNEAGRKQSQLWAQAQMEWTQRVTVGGEAPKDVADDMLTRYQVNPIVPANWPAPRMGAVTSMDDVKRVAAATQAAVKAGTMSADQGNTEAQLLVRYGKFYQDQQARQAATAAALRSKSAQPQAAGKAKLKGVVAQESQ